MTGTVIAEIAGDTASGVRGRGPARRVDGPNLGGVVGLCMALIGTVIGSQRLSDNSFLTHLATGREMIAHGFVHRDVFTWTSQGRELVVQSWLASLLYGFVEQIAGLGGLRLLMAATAGLLAWISWRLSDEAPSLFTRLVVMAPVLVVGAVMWSERPLLIALVLFGMTLLVTRGRGSPVWMVVIGVIWIGVHGSWPLGLVLLAGRAIGARLDHDDPVRELRALKWLGAGILIGGVFNPYGPRLLAFPFELLGRREILSNVAEWRSPSFDVLYARAFLVIVIMLIVAVTRRWSWRTLLPAIVFVAAALVSRRNIPLATLAVIPVLAAGLPSLGRLASGDSSEMTRRLGHVLTVLVVVFPLLLVRPPNLDLSQYPVEAVDAMETAGVSPAVVHVIHPDFVGNYLELRYGDAAAAWIDDRYELHKTSLMADYLTLFDAGPGWREVLDRSGGDVLLWPTDKPLTQLVRDVAGWHTLWADADWTVLCRPDVIGCGESSNLG